MAFLNKYGVARHIYIPLPKAGSASHAVNADWTPVAGDVKISKDGGATANVTNLPVAIAMGNSALWDFSLSATEMQAAQVLVLIADSATKAVDDSGFELETYGNASAQHVFDFGVATQKVDVDTIKTNPVVNAGTITFPTTATLASTTNITAGTITTTTSVTNGVTLAAGQKVDVDTIKTNPVVNAGTITFPTTATLASTTNITGGTITTTTNVTHGVTLAAGQKVDVDTIKTNPVVNAGTITFPTNATLASTTNLTAGTIAAVGTLTTYTGNTPQTGDAYAALTAVRTEPGQGAPGVSISGLAKLDFLYKAWRNRHTQDATTFKLYADDSATVDHKATVSDDGTTFDRAKVATGP